jgi:hypothetical protein
MFYSLYLLGIVEVRKVNKFYFQLGATVLHKGSVKNILLFYVKVVTWTEKREKVCSFYTSTSKRR